MEMKNQYKNWLKEERKKKLKRKKGETKAKEEETKVKEETEVKFEEIFTCKVNIVTMQSTK